MEISHFSRHHLNAHVRARAARIEGFNRPNGFTNTGRETSNGLCVANQSATVCALWEQIAARVTRRAGVERYGAFHVRLFVSGNGEKSDRPADESIAIIATPTSAPIAIQWDPVREIVENEF